jgi:hypothetical protein
MTPPSQRRDEIFYTVPYPLCFIVCHPIDITAQSKMAQHLPMGLAMKRRAS